MYIPPSLNNTQHTTHTSYVRRGIASDDRVRQILAVVKGREKLGRLWGYSRVPHLLVLSSPAPLGLTRTRHHFHLVQMVQSRTPPLALFSFSSGLKAPSPIATHTHTHSVCPPREWNAQRTRCYHPHRTNFNPSSFNLFDLLRIVYTKKEQFVLHFFFEDTKSAHLALSCPGL